MKVTFYYDKEKDIWCLLNVGKSSTNSNSQVPTKQYQQFVAQYGENPTFEMASEFIEKYVVQNEIDIQDRIRAFQKDWDNVSEEYQKRAQSIFGVSLSDNIVAYLTINSRCPYFIDNNYFYVSLESVAPTRTIMHELWHFYTWYALIGEEEKLGAQRYNDIKESLTVLLNVECKDLLLEGIIDHGYPQHQDMRQKILEYWKTDRNIKNLWNYIAN